MSESEKKNKIKSLGEGFFELENGDVEVVTKDGNFVLTDIPFEKLERAQKKSSASGSGDIIPTLCESLTSWEGKKEGVDRLGELTLRGFRTSTILKLTKAMNYILGVDDSENL